MRWSIGFFGVKDLFTLINLAGGVCGIYFAAQAHSWEDLRLAAYAILGGYLFGDALDGPVARATRTGNRFGGEFDSAADHIGQGIAPAVIVFRAFDLMGHTVTGIVLMGALVATASIRQARFNVDRFDFPLCYCGLPRTVSGLVSVSLPNATLFFKHSFAPYWIGVGVIAFVAVMNLVPVPYMTHKGRTMQGYVKAGVAVFLLSPIALFFLAPQFLFDAMFFMTFSYALGAWIPVLPEERRAYWAEYRRWSRQVATLK